MSRLALKLHMTTGAEVDLAVLEGIQLARQLGLAYVHFDGNENNYTCYPDNRALRMSSRSPGHATFDGRAGYTIPLEWRQVDPIRCAHVRDESGVCTKCGARDL